jgi:hypothetical protein
MNHILGSAVEIFCEIPSAKVTGTTLTLESLVDPDGTNFASSQSLTFDLTTTNLASVVWQSASGTHKTGKYKFLVKAANGARVNYGKGSFYLTEQ